MILPEVYKRVGVEPGKPLPSFAWPGGYPLVYYCRDGGELCPDCANGMNGSMVLDPEYDDDQWTVVTVDIYWEGPPIQCQHCWSNIESAYGDPEVTPRSEVQEHLGG